MHVWLFAATSTNPTSSIILMQYTKCYYCVGLAPIIHTYFICIRTLYACMHVLYALHMYTLYNTKYIIIIRRETWPADGTKVKLHYPAKNRKS